MMEPMRQEPSTAEHARLAEADAGVRPWRSWGPYLAERAWGTVREDYSEHGNAWSYFPHDHARSRVFRWNEDGMAGICDEKQTFCFALALWNGKDPILKERMFGLSGDTGNHGEDVKEYYWYEDSTPTHSSMRWRYHYPQAAYPYRQLMDGNAARGRKDPEYELIDTGVFAEDRYWSITVDYAKADVTDLCMVVTVANRGPETATLHVLPTLWFRNSWGWGATRPRRHSDDHRDRGRPARRAPRDHGATRAGRRRDRGDPDRPRVRQRRQRRAALGACRSVALSEGRHQRPRRVRGRNRQSRRYGDQGGIALRAHGAGRRSGDDPVAARFDRGRPA